MSSKMEVTRALELVALLRWKRFLRAVAQNCLMHLLAFGQKFARKLSLCMCLLSSRAFHTIRFEKQNLARRFENENVTPMYLCWGSLSVVFLRYLLSLLGIHRVFCLRPEAQVIINLDSQVVSTVGEGDAQCLAFTLSRTLVNSNLDYPRFVFVNLDIVQLAPVLSSFYEFLKIASRTQYRDVVCIGQVVF